MYAPQSSIPTPAVRAASTRQPPVGASNIDLLTKIAKLHEQGVLTDEEFAKREGEDPGDLTPRST